MLALALAAAFSVRAEDQMLVAPDTVEVQSHTLTLRGLLWIHGSLNGGVEIAV